MVAQLIKNPTAMQETPVRFLGQEDPLRRDRLPTPVFLGFPCGSAGKESACNVGDLGLIPGLGRFPWRRKRQPTPVFWPREFHGLYRPWGCKESDFPGGSDSKVFAYNVGDLVSIPGWGRCPGEGNGNPFQYSCLENSMDRRS